MSLTLVKILVSACIIALASWLAGKKPELAGFIVALPLTSLLALAFAHGQHADPAASVRFAKSIFAAVPLSLLFFVPFLLAEKLPLNFHGLYAAGLVLLAGGYFLHAFLMRAL